MVRVLFAVFAVLSVCAVAEAKPRRGYNYAYSTYSGSVPSGVDTSTAQGVAEAQARTGQCRHFGGNSGYEGVGFSTNGPEEAKRNCCFWGQRTPVDIGIARGARGWFACVRYR